VASGRSTKETRREQTRRRVEAQRAAQLRAERRRRVTYAIGIPLALLAAIGLIVLVAVNRAAPVTTSFGAAPASVVTPLTTVPASALDSVGVGTTTTDTTKKLTGAALTSKGKPRVLYAGAEYCPYCAFERWGMVVALSRFGTFTGLDLMKSSPTDVYPNMNTLSFRNASYTSKYLVFDGTELQDRNGAVLQELPAADNALFSSIGGGSYPFIDVGGRWYQSTSGTTTALNAVHGKTWQQIADALKDPSSPVAKAVLGTANQLTAQICSITNDQPSTVCSASGVQAAAKALSSVQ